MSQETFKQLFGSAANDFFQDMFGVMGLGPRKKSMGRANKTMMCEKCQKKVSRPKYRC